jgi:hypothetical protein
MSLNAQFLPRIGLLVLLALFLPQFSHAAIAYDNSTECNNVSSGGTCTLTVGSAANRIEIIFFRYDNTSATPPSFSCGGGSATVINTNSSGGQEDGIYYLIAPTSGSNVCTITSSLSADIALASYSGALQTGQPDNHRTTTFSGTGLSQAITVSAANSWVVLATDNSVSCSGTYSSPTNLTSRQTNAGCSAWTYGDSNGTAAAGSFTQSATMASSQTFVVFQVSIAPAASVASTFQLWPLSLF